MKRTALKPGKPLRRKKGLTKSAMPARKRALRQRSVKRAGQAPVRRAVVEVLRARSGGVCEMQISMWAGAGSRRWVCTGRAVDPCHLVRDGQGGAMSPANLLYGCRACHQWTHDHGDTARLKGWMRKTFDSPRSAVLWRAQWAALTEDGRVLAATCLDYPGDGAPPVVVEVGDVLAVAA